MFIRLLFFCRRFLSALVSAGCVLALAPTGRAAQPWTLQAAASRDEPGIFPPIAAEALDRTPLNLPAQLEGRQNLLLLSWARDQAPQLDTWTAVAQALEHTRVDFRVYRMPVSAPENLLYRWWDTASLRADETDPELLHWSVPLFTDKAALRKSLGLREDEHTVVALLVDRSGHVLWKAEGPSTAATRAGLLAAARPAP